MLKSRKHVFWEALIVTIAIFLAGLFLGMMIEASNSNKVSQLYIQSEISLVDATAASQISEMSSTDCEIIRQKNIEFADRIYEEAKILEQYESSGKLTESLKLLHKKYDLLRTLLWMSNQDSLERCGNYHLIVYLYEYETEDLTKKAEQNVWSKILLDLKNEDEKTLLIPIAADSGITSLDLLIAPYKIDKFPALIINNKEVLYTVEDTQSIKDHF